MHSQLTEEHLKPDCRPCRFAASRQAAWPSTAPPAPAYAAERARGSAHSLAEAVLSGLPAHDEAVALARAAAAAGKSLQEVAAWGREVDYTATAYRVAARGRIQADGAKVRPRPIGQRLMRVHLGWEDFFG